MRLVSGVGFNDAGYPVNPRVAGKIVPCPYYRAWSDMLKRCYNLNYQSKHPTYIGCEVCEEWLTFSKFKAWMEDQDWEGNQLDKDILKAGNKLYSPAFCIFVSPLVNSFILEPKLVDNGLPTGVSFHNKNKKYIAQCKRLGDRENPYIGSYDTAEEARSAYLAKKTEYARVLSAQQTDSRVAKRLIEMYKEDLQ